MNIMQSLGNFFDELYAIVGGKAQQKGYASLNAKDSSGRETLDFVKQHAPGHAEGEMMYKIIRWTKKRQPEDLLKLAAWAFLVWDQYRRERAGQQTEAPLVDHMVVGREPYAEAGPVAPATYLGGAPGLRRDMQEAQERHAKNRCTPTKETATAPPADRISVDALSNHISNTYITPSDAYHLMKKIVEQARRG